MIDLVKLHFKAGKGGDGRLSFHRAKFMPKGGPDGGNGGDGGSIILRGTRGMNTLNHFAGKKGFAAEEGEMGGKSQMFGHKGQDLIIEVPIGTVVWKVEEELDPEQENEFPDSEANLQKLATVRLDTVQKTKVTEILTEGQEYLLAKGGKGGRGNEHFKSSRNTTPMETEKGTPGDEFEVLLELKLLADVGLVGLPNAGKSSFLARATKANPRIANYPFTTIEPHLGVMDLGQGREAVVADIPGIIEGASEGKGLGFQFLRHIDRCRALLYVLFLEESVIYNDDMTDAQKAKTLIEQYDLLKKELHKYSPDLLELQSLAIVSKADLYTEELKAEIKSQLKAKKMEFIFWSGTTKEGFAEIQKKMLLVLG